MTEKLTYERRLRETKLKAALLQARKMNSEMSELIEKTKVQEQVNERRKKRKLEDEGDSGNQPSASGSSGDAEERMQKQMKRKFKQNRMIGAEYDDHGNKMDKRLLNSIFARAKDQNNDS